MACCLRRTASFLIQLVWFWAVLASPRVIIAPQNLPSVTDPATISRASPNLAQKEGQLKIRQAGNSLVTCGYLSGDEKHPRSAAPGFNCRVDTQRGLWGFCPTTVIAASDCGLAGNCIDKHSCSRGCGLAGIPGITTFTCGSQEFCSTAILALGTDAHFSYIACGQEAITETYFPSPTRATDTTTDPSPKKSPSSPESTESTSVTSTSPGASASNTGQTANADPGDNGQPSNTGAIIGGVIGGLALICITTVVTLYLLRRSRQNHAAIPGAITENNAPPSMSTTPAVVPWKPETACELEGGRYATPTELPG